MHMVARRVAAAVALQFLGRGQRQPRARHAERMAEGDGAAVGVHMARIVRDAELAEDGEALGGEGLVEFDDVHVVDLEAEALEQLLRRRRRADAHDPRRNAGDGGAEDPGARGQAVALGRLLAGDDQRGGAVVDARGVAGGDAAVLADDGLQRRQFVEAGQARMLVLVDDQRVALALRDGDRDDLGGETAVGLRGGRLLLAAQREGVLVLRG